MKKHFKSLAFFALALIITVDWVFPSDSNAVVSEEMDTFIKGVMQKAHIPGLSVCLLKNNDIIWSNAYGWADIENKVPMSLDTVQNIASVSKTVTMTAIMQLWEKGLLKLDDDINTYLPFKVHNPHFPNAVITFRQLLTHRASLKDSPVYTDSYSRGDPKTSLEIWLKEYLVPGGKYYNPKENFHSWKPGKTDKIPKKPSAYSNVGFGLLGYLVERISNMPFDEYTKKNIFEPLEMDETSWYIKDIDVKKQAVPYFYFTADEIGLTDVKEVNEMIGLYPNRPIKVGYFPLSLYSFPNYPDGSLRTSVSQFSHFLLMFMNDGNFKGKQILKKTTVNTILSNDHFNRALCWDINKAKDDRIFWEHSGGDAGIGTMIAFNREHKTGFIVFSNNLTAELINIIVPRLRKELGK